MPLCVFAAPEDGVELAACVFVAEVAAGFAAGFAGVAGFFAGAVELSVAAGALAAGGFVDGFVAGGCCATAVPAKIKVAATTLTAMLGSFRMALVSQRFAACANGVIRDW